MTRDDRITDLLTRAQELIRQGRNDEAVTVLREVQAMLRERIH